jgi:hypothetical protein
LGYRSADGGERILKFGVDAVDLGYPVEHAGKLILVAAPGPTGKGTI